MIDSHWLELSAESGLINADRLTELQREAHELVAIITASRKTAEHGPHAASVAKLQSQITNHKSPIGKELDGT